MSKLAGLAILLLSATPWGAVCPGNQPKSESALLELEQTWAHALTQHDSDTVACILAGEFQDFDPNGDVYDRAQALAKIPHRRPGSNQLSDLHPHVHGDFGYVRGLNTILDPEGKAVAKVRFTDIFVYRDGRWMAVAAQESLVGGVAR